MGWEHTLRKLHVVKDHDAPHDPRLAHNGHAPDERVRGAPRANGPSASKAPRPAASVCVASGKGGTGKSVVTASLATLLATRGNTLLLDADLGVGNAHILFDLAPPHSLVDVVHGQCRVRDVVVPCGERLALVAGGSGVSHMAGLSAYELHLVAHGIQEIESEYDFLVVDSGAGISEQTIAFAAACDVVLVVTTPDLTAMTDAYALLKVLLAHAPACAPLLVVNRVVDELDDNADPTAERVAERLCSVCRRFLAREPRFIGRVPEDRAVGKSIAARRPVMSFAPGSPSALALQALALPLIEELVHAPRRGLGHTLVESIGFAPHRS